MDKSKFLSILSWKKTLGLILFVLGAIVVIVSTNIVYPIFERKNFSKQVKVETLSAIKSGIEFPISIPAVVVETIPGSSIYVAGEYAYIYNWNDRQFRIIDASNPSLLTLAGKSPKVPGHIDLFYVSGKYAYVTWTTYFLGKPDRDGFTIFDISNPRRIIKLKDDFGISVDHHYPYLLYVTERYAYLENIIIDVSNPSSAVQVGKLSVEDIASIYTSGKYAYIGIKTWRNPSEFIIEDVSNPRSPIKMGSLDMPFSDMPSSIDSIQVSGKYAYIALNSGGGWSQNSEFMIIDIFNPFSPVKVASLKIKGSNISSLYISGKYAFIGSNYGELRIIDISNPLSPTEIAKINMPGVVGGIYISKEYAYLEVTAGPYYFKIINLSGLIEFKE